MDSCLATACPLTHPFSLPEALRRFEQEATRGVYSAGPERCSFYVWGAGPPLVLIHGMGDSARGYIPLASLLSTHFRCIAYDLAENQEEAEPSHAWLARHLIGLLDHLDVRQSYVFGSSLGGAVALAGMHTHPDRLPRGILAGSFARRRLAPAELVVAFLSQFIRRPMHKLPGRRHLSRRALGPAAGERTELIDYFLHVAGEPTVASVARRALLIHRLDLRHLLAEIGQPVLLVCGDGDHVVNTTCADELARGLPRAVRASLPDCGHLPHYTHPELLAEVVREFLTPAQPGDPLSLSLSRAHSQS
jgi:pimeloyl-[acyl-carrier protein] methyl ester esterase